MAISSINIQPSSINAFAHNDRTLSPSYLLDQKDSLGIECNRSSKEAQELYLSLRNEAFGNYTLRTGQKVQIKEEKLRWSAVVNLNAHHTIKDVEKLALALEKKYGWQVLQVAIHRDEGFIKDGKAQYNHHAHIEFFMLDKQGIFRFKKRDFGAKKMSELQDIVSSELSMQRGVSKLESKRERLEHREYKQQARALESAAQELEREKLSKEQLKEEFEKFRKENANKGFTSAFFRELGEEKKRQLQEPTMNRKDIQEFVEALKERHKKLFGFDKDAVIEEIKDKLIEQAKENASLKEIALKAISSIDSEKERLAEEARQREEKLAIEFRQIVANEKKELEKKREELTLQSVVKEVVLLKDEAIKILEKSLKSIEEKYNNLKESFSQLLSEKLKLEAENETLNKKLKILTETLEIAQKSLETQKTTQDTTTRKKSLEIDARAKIVRCNKKDQENSFER